MLGKISSMRKKTSTTQKIKPEIAKENKKMSEVIKNVSVNAAIAANGVTKKVEEKETAVKETRTAEVETPTKLVATENKSDKKKTPAVKKANVKKQHAKVTEVAYIEFADNQINILDVIESAKAHYTALYEKEKGSLHAISVYIKPDEKVAYYTANGIGCDEYKVGI